ncbi:MAG: non-canonical purine NTP pyrophosphatase, RdgB/HAM1 family [Candidatus Melainabacteria bacterium]|nr:MAG: non-canonical purine NTP pyrophosphatase, RdgB/HAM1 family [Candidatus Melainabacteria bacterium]
MKLVLGTKNPGKLRELFQLADNVDDLELELAPENFDPEENGSTFAENALIKAREAAKLTGLMSLGEDSGIEVDALGGKPGIYSARYCQGSDVDRRVKLLQELSGVPVDKRGAAYICAMALVNARGELLHNTSGKWSGQIGFSEKGSNGFGYDPIFYLPDHKQTVAEISSAEKNRFSHRAQAWRAMLEYLKQLKYARKA